MSLCTDLHVDIGTTWNYMELDQNILEACPSLNFACMDRLSKASDAESVTASRDAISVREPATQQLLPIGGP